jgi:hypothetical protein
MAGNYNHKYSEISSFESLRLEKERLILKSKLAGAKIDLDISRIERALSVSNLILSFAKEYVLPNIMDLLGELSNKMEDKVQSE